MIQDFLHLVTRLFKMALQKSVTINSIETTYHKILTQNTSYISDTVEVYLGNYINLAHRNTAPGVPINTERFDVPLNELQDETRESIYEYIKTNLATYNGALDV